MRGRTVDQVMADTPTWSPPRTCRMTEDEASSQIITDEECGTVVFGELVKATNRPHGEKVTHPTTESFMMTFMAVWRCGGGVGSDGRGVGEGGNGWRRKIVDHENDTLW